VFHQAQTGSAEQIWTGGTDSRFEIRAGVDDRDSQVVTERCELEEDRSVRADLRVNNAIGHELADDQSHVCGSGSGDASVELREHVPTRSRGSASPAGHQD
jgi:hypothetical protein